MKPTVLVIEDMPAVSRLVEVCLTAAELAVETRADGPSGLAAVYECRPDLLVLDIGLPGMDGWEILERLRADESTRDLPILILTAHGSDDNRKRALLAGADAFIPKPFRPFELRRSVQNLLQRQSFPHPTVT